MVHAEVLRRRLELLEEALGVLEELGQLPRETFVSDPKSWAAAERFLQLAVEALNDMAAHVVAERGWGKVEAARDLPRRFLEHGLIDAELAGRWSRMIGLRNILVHAYLQVDRERIHRILREGLGDLRALAAVMARFL